MKKAISLILTVLMIVSSFSVMSLVSAKETNVVSSGDAYSRTTGDCTWNFDEDTGTLTISGEGDMGNNAPWNVYNQDIKSVNIKNGVKSIGNLAFYQCYNLINISIPSSVKKIGDNAFGCCFNLVSITIPNSVTSIGTGAFYYCSKLKSINLSNSINSISSGIFRDCSSLTNITIPQSVISIGLSAFWGCTSLKNIIIPDSVTSIDGCAFLGCTSLTNMMIPNGILSISGRSFSGCTNLNSIVIPSSVTLIDSGAFDNCTSLNDIYYYGTKEQWDKIIINPYNDYLLNANIHYSSVPMPTKPTVNKITKVALNKKSVTLNKGKSTTVKATVTPANATNKKLKWTTSNSKVATVSQSGKVIAKSRGIAIIKAMSTDGSNKYANLKVTVKQPVTSVKLNRNSVNLKVKGNAKQKTVTLKAKVYPNNANNKTVKWSTSKSKIATVNSKGKVIAKKKGTCYIIATAKDGSKKSAKCKITVK